MQLDGLEPNANCCNAAINACDKSSEWTCALDSLPSMRHDELETNDWVIDGQRLGSIIRFGYGLYDGQVRIAYCNENPNDWTAGIWRSKSALERLMLPFHFQVGAKLHTANKPGVGVQSGVFGYLIGFNREGDLVITLDGDLKKHGVFVDDARNLIMTGD